MGMQIAPTKDAHQQDQPVSITVGHIAEKRLNQKGHKSRNAGNHTDLGHVQGKFVRQYRQQGSDKSLEKIAGKMNQKQGKNRFFVDLAGVGHRLSHAGIFLTPLLYHFARQR